MYMGKNMLIVQPISPKNHSRKTKRLIGNEIHPGSTTNLTPTTQNK